MRLLVISPTPHYQVGVLKGHGSTIKEINYLSSIFEHITHIAPLYGGKPPESFLSYNSSRIEFIPIPPAGGHSIREKINILTVMPKWINTIKKILKNNRFDLIHIRTPSSLSYTTLLYFKTTKIDTLKWIKFAGNWENNPVESTATRLQKHILKSGIYKSFITLNYIKDLPSNNFIPFPNPSFYLDDYLAKRECMKTKHITYPINFIFIGNLYKTKGIMEALHIILKLKKRNIALKFNIIGSGPMDSAAKNFVLSNGLKKHVTFHGSLPHEKVFELLKISHFLLFPTSFNEGWPKVISESMCSGTVPITGSVSIIPEILNKYKCGFSAPAQKINKLVDAIIHYIKNPEEWELAKENAYKYAVFFTYEYYGLKLIKTLKTLGLKSIDADVGDLRLIKSITGKIQFIF